MVLIYSYCESIVRTELETFTDDQIKARQAEVEALLSRFNRWPQCAHYQTLLHTLWQEALALAGTDEIAVDSFHGAGTDGSKSANSDGALYSFLARVLQNNTVGPPVIEDPIAFPDLLEWVFTERLGKRDGHVVAQH